MGAGEYCNRNGMRLAVITSDSDNRVVLDLIHKAKAKDSKLANVWIGASDMSKEGTFVWQATGLPVSYNDWAPTQPDNWQKNEHCAEFANRGYTKWTWSWNDLRCDTVQNFVCENTQRNKIVEFLSSDTEVFDY